MPEIPDFHGPHVEPPMLGHIKLAWDEPTPRAPRIRVLSHTCECQEMTYELCAATGLGFVRRTDRAKRTVHETTWMPATAAGLIFTQTLHGEAR